MKIKKNVLSSLIIMLAGVIYLPVQAQQKNGFHRANFYGDWKLNKSKSELAGNFPVCIFWEGDRVFSNTMKIAGSKNLLTVKVTSSSPDWPPVATQEKLIFDGKEKEATVFGYRRDESAARWSDNGQTMIVNSGKYTYAKGKTAKDKTPDIKVKEVWKLINDGQSICVLVSAGVDTRKLVYDKL